jgi:voltage-gated potassium channel
MYSKIKHRIYQILEKAEGADKSSRAFDVFIVTLIILNGIVIILNFIPTLSLKYYVAFNIFETISVSVFTIEYFLRLWTCNLNKKYKGSFKGRLKYMFTPLALIDLLAIIPLYIPMIFLFDPKISKAIRLLRIFKLLKFCRYFEFMQILARVIRKKKIELLITIFAAILLIIISSSLIYEFEYAVQPESFSEIPRAMWWAVVPLTTVGYCDIHPMTTLGKVIGAIIAFLYISFFALPAGIISSGMIIEIREKNKKKVVCPKCGQIIEMD